MVDIKSLIEENRAGRVVGLPCFCTANEHVLKAVLSHAARAGAPTVIEATCNQVNQEGGYTGMTAQDFASWVHTLAAGAGVAPDQIVLGGDHLGPNPWRKDNADHAMRNARALVRDYAAAGFRKIHLDASMACGGEPPLSFAQIAERAADLCAVAEANAPDPEANVYIIGTEVPTPGGETEDTGTLDVTSAERLRDTIATHREAFEERGLENAWSRIVGIVTQPGVDFSHTSVHTFDPARAAPLRDALATEPGLAFEAHSTDYQATEALRALVDNRFFFLKVGPELTFRFREAVYALAEIEELLVPERPSHLREIVASRMAEKPEYWREYYKGNAKQIEFLKRFSYSDRIRYYWTDPAVRQALARLLANLSERPLPQNVVTQFFACFEFGETPSDPRAILEEHIEKCVRRYFSACGFS